jgi:hypothetical protein
MAAAARGEYVGGVVVRVRVGERKRKERGHTARERAEYVCAKGERRKERETDYYQNPPRGEKSEEKRRGREEREIEIESGQRLGTALLRLFKKREEKAVVV